MTTLVAGRARRIATSAVLVSVVVVIVLVSSVLLGATGAAGNHNWATNPICIMAMGLASIVLALAASWTMFAGNAVMSRWIAALAGTIVGYMFFTALAEWLNLTLHRTDLFTQLVVSFAIGLWVFPLSVLQAASLTAVEQATGRNFTLLKWIPIGIVCAVTVAGMVAFPLFAPFSFRTPLLDDTWFTSAAVVWVIEMIRWVWMASLIIIPIVLWVSVKGLRGNARRRTILAAIASVLPVAVVTVCEVLYYAFQPAGMTQSAGEVVLMITFAVGAMFAGVVLVFASRADDASALVEGRRLSFLLNTVIGFFFIIAALTVSIGLGTMIGGGAIFLVAIVTLVISLTLMPLYRRTVRWLISRADSQLAAAARVVSESPLEARHHPAELAERAIRVGLSDPEATLLVREVDGEGWVDVAGAAMDDDGPNGRHHLPIIAEGVTVAELVHGSDDDTASRLVESLKELVDRAVLEVTVKAQQRRLEGERGRSEAAVVEERRRLERNLHDGVQGRLLGLALNLRGAQVVVDDPRAQLVLDEAVASLRAAIDDLRTLASGDMPERLSRHGLLPALDDLVAGMPMDIRISAPERRFGPETEAIAYYVVSEGVTNAAKHASSRCVDVTIAESDDGLTIDVLDDGVGGADARLGSGLRGLRERVNAAGGQLSVGEAVPHGTLLHVSMPSAH